MRIVDTSTTEPKNLTPFEREQVYNGLDCCVTAELVDILLPQLDNQTASTYAFSKSLQGPVLEMRLRGVLIDQVAKAEVIEKYFEQLDILERQLERIVREGLDFYGFNWRSNDDLKELFYTRLKLPVIRKAGRPTCERDALEKMEGYLVARPIIAHLLVMRDIGKKISVLKTAIDPDGRVRTSYNIAGTNTFRFSSSFSEFGTGGNLQNVEELLRRIFIADPGYKLGCFDGEQIQSRIVGGLEWHWCDDGRYLDACESGDLHTYVAKMCEPGYGWTGDLKLDKELADGKPYYRQHSLRKLCKSIGHGTNFKGRPPTLNRMYKVDIWAIEDFQRKYIPAFGHKKWWEWVENELISTGTIHSITGNRRQFWGRRDADDTLREAIAFDPQCSESKIVNSGMLRVWHELQGEVQLLMQGHDCIIVQYKEEKEDEVVPKILELMRYPVELKHGRQLIIPYGAKTGWNWGPWAKDNVDGLAEYKGQDKRKRTPSKSILDRIVRSTHRQFRKP